MRMDGWMGSEEEEEEARKKVGVVVPFGGGLEGGAVKWLVGAYISGLGQFRTRKTERGGEAGGLWMGHVSGGGGVCVCVCVCLAMSLSLPSALYHL